MIFVKAIVVMIGISFASHLGLLEAICKVMSKVLDCCMCSTFWSCVVLLICTGENPVKAAIVSILVAYLSNWVTFILVYLQQKYDETWQRLKRNKK